VDLVVVVLLELVELLMEFLEEMAAMADQEELLLDILVLRLVDNG
jgi:hypothetical protein